jgi:hypothetical protein
LSTEIDDLPLDNLTNAIHPMFHPSRWATGQDQYTRDFYPEMRAGLQLASLLLTEDSVLGWFTHIAYGDKRRDRNGKIYLGHNSYEDSKAARDDVRKHFEIMSEVVTFSFIPRAYVGAEYGVSYDSRRDVPYNHLVQHPPIDRSRLHRENQGRSRPVCTLHIDFARFFKTHHDVVTRSVGYRTMFVFATTLVHEFCHAYGYWLGFMDEPLYTKGDAIAELGFSWEQVTLGRVMNPLHNETHSCSLLTSINFQTYARPQDRERAIGRVTEDRAVSWKLVRPRGEFRDRWEHLLEPQDTRGGRYFAGTSQAPGKMIAGCLQAIPTKWIMSWFRKASWEKRARQWELTRSYVPTKMPMTFMILYEKIGNEASVSVSLHAEFRHDAREIREQEEWDRENEMVMRQGYYEGEWDDRAGRRNRRR